MSLIAFKKDPKISYVYIPGCGNVTSKTLLFGEKYLRYVGKGLVAVDAAPLTNVIEDKQASGTSEVMVLDELPQVQLDAMTTPLDIPQSEEEQLQDLEVEIPTKKKSSGRPKKDKEVV